MKLATLFILIGFQELLGRPVKEVPVCHLGHFEGEWVDACHTNEAEALRQRPDRALPDEAFDGAVHTVDGHGRVPVQEECHLNRPDICRLFKITGTELIRIL